MGYFGVLGQDFAWRIRGCCDERVAGIIRLAESLEARGRGPKLTARQRAARRRRAAVGGRACTWCRSIHDLALGGACLRSEAETGTTSTYHLSGDESD
jgi:hypothetical protein